MIDFTAEIEREAEKIAKIENINSVVYAKLKSGQQKQTQLIDRGLITTQGLSRIVIELINQDEIYLVDEDFNRVKRICGGTVSVKERTKDPCQNMAGLFTAHKNFGRCHVHEKQGAKNTFDRFIKAKQKDGSLISYYDAAKKIPDTEIEDLYPQARLILAFTNMFRHSVETRIIEHTSLIEKRKLIWESYSDEKKLERALEGGGITANYQMVFDHSGNFIMELTTTWTQQEIAFFTILQDKYKNMVTSGKKLKTGLFVTPKAMDAMFAQIFETVKAECGDERAFRINTLLVQNILFSEGMVRDGTKELGDMEITKIHDDTKKYIGNGR